MISNQFIEKCASEGVPPSIILSLLKSAASDPNLQRATAIFQDWLTVPKHTVRRGEVLSGIARKYKIGLQDLMKENGISSTVGIKPGQTLRIPKAKEPKIQNKVMQTRQ